MPILVIAEHDNQQIKNSTLNTITAARQIGEDIHLLVAGAGCKQAAENGATVKGVAKVLLADASALAHGLPENLAEQVLAIARDYTHLLVPASSFGKAVMPRIAAKLDVEQVSEITKVVASDTFERPIYAGNAIATVQSTDAIKALTVRTTAFAPAEKGNAAPVKKIDAVTGTGKAIFQSAQSDKSDRPELSSARVVVAGGQGIGSKENFKLVEQLADRLSAAIGASRAAVDAGYVSNELQIGQTGKIIAPDLYIAVGISGAVQHVAGIKDAKTIVAINQDADAPIFLTSDYGIVGDLNEVVPQLISALG
ncbi:MAG: electron transfer flavoprotein subunit alpha/FixB family protein [Oxalobacter sp.]